MFLVQAYRRAAFSLFGLTSFTRSGYEDHAKSFKLEETQVDMTGKNCMVTGANSGIGFATAETLAARGANVYMVCRNKHKGEEALTSIVSKTGNSNVFLEVCDMASLTEIKDFGTKFTSRKIPLHVLVNNAGLLEHKRLTSADGLEFNFAINVAGTYAVTELLLPSLEMAAPYARVITVSSGGMYTAPLTDDLQFSEGDFDGTLQYARNKRLQVAITERWAELYANRGIGFYSMHPGWSATPGVARSLPQFNERLEGKLRTAEQGADTIVWLSLQPKENLKSGAFYFDRKEARKHLPLAGTNYLPDQVDSIIASVRTLCGLP